MPCVTPIQPIFREITMANITRHAGRITLLGARQQRGNIIKCSVLEIGNQSLRNVTFTEYLGNYLELAVEGDRDVSFATQKSWNMGGPYLYALKLDGKAYQDDEAIKANDNWITLLCFMSMITPGALVTIPYLLYRFFWGKRADNTQREAAAQAL